MEPKLYTWLCGVFVALGSVMVRCRWIEAGSCRRSSPANPPRTARTRPFNSSDTISVRLIEFLSAPLLAADRSLVVPAGVIAGVLPASDFIKTMGSRADDENYIGFIVSSLLLGALVVRPRLELP